MAVVLQMDFPLDGPWGQEMADAFTELGQSIADTPGLLWKIWTENAEEKRAGGLYAFEDTPQAQAYLDMHTARMKDMGVTEIRSVIFDVNEPLTRLTRGPLA